jgi:uncharacterized spore protein YtfJ
VNPMNPMNVQEIMAQARDTLTVKRVFGEPVEEQGVTIIPVATIRGGAGGGQNEGPDGESQGGGSGFGIMAKPAGAFVVKDGTASWRPALDLNRVIMGGQAVAITALLTARAIVKTRAASGGSRNRRRFRPIPFRR